jgi:hypothetical protein
MSCNDRGARCPETAGHFAGGSAGQRSALVILAVAALLAMAACSSPGAAPAPSASGRSPAPPGSGRSGGASSAPARPGIVAVTSSGALVVLNSSTGATTSTLVSSGVVGQEIAVSPDGSTVYFTAGNGCTNEIESVPASGGTPTAIAPGVLPAISPDGSRLAFAQEPWFLPTSCAASAPPETSDFSLAVRTLSTGSQVSYPMAAPAAASGLPIPILYLSWAPDNEKLAVTASGIQDNEGWTLNILDTASAQYYLAGPGDTTVPVTGAPDPSDSYYEEAAYLPDGNLFVNRDCCLGTEEGQPPPADSNLMQEVSASGSLIRQVSIGIQANDHTSLDADPSGYWLLYITGAPTAGIPSGSLEVSPGGAKPAVLTTGLTAAAWL